MAVYNVPALPLFDEEHYPNKKDFGVLVVRFEEEIKRSRFITTLAHADSRASALLFVTAVRREFPDARHHCWAYVAGPPGDTGLIGQSDDGEPHGTAGRPMLNQLLHGGIGELAAVTSRYFGGIKLGTGRLMRAYQNGVKEALLLLPVMEKEVLCRATVEVKYAHVDRVYRILPQFRARVVSENFGNAALVTLELPEDRFNACVLALRELTDGYSCLTKTFRN